MNTYIVIQPIIKKVIDEHNARHVTTSNIVRQVIALNRTDAVNKFEHQTEGIKAIHKLKIECYNLHTLITIE